MTDELLAYSLNKMKEYGIVDSGDTLRDGIGAMTDARAASFFEKMARAGVVRPDIDFRKAYTLRFVNKGGGLDLRPKNYRPAGRACSLSRQLCQHVRPPGEPAGRQRCL